MLKLKSLNCMCYRWEIVYELREWLSTSPMSTVYKKNKVKCDAYFYNDICPDDSDSYSDSESETESESDS